MSDDDQQRLLPIKKGWRRFFTFGIWQRCFTLQGYGSTDAAAPSTSRRTDTGTGDGTGNGTDADTVAGLQITYSDVVYKRGHDTVLLDKISVNFTAGLLIALMGPSGAGKTSLMDLLTGNWKGPVTGKSRPNITYTFSYILQDDMFEANLTVMEMMLYRTNLRSVPKVSFNEKLKQIRIVLKNLKLHKREKTNCKDLSGGEKRRLSVALELLADPQVLIIDEPTSGLDADTAMQLIEILSSIKNDKIIICSIHQPSPELFSLFDQVYVLLEGSFIYKGHVRALETFLDQEEFKQILQARRGQNEKIDNSPPKKAAVAGCSKDASNLQSPIRPAEDIMTIAGGHDDKCKEVQGRMKAMFLGENICTVGNVKTEDFRLEKKKEFFQQEQVNYR